MAKSAQNPPKSLKNGLFQRFIKFDPFVFARNGLKLKSYIGESLGAIPISGNILEKCTGGKNDPGGKNWLIITPSEM